MIAEQDFTIEDAMLHPYEEIIPLKQPAVLVDDLLVPLEERII